MPSSVNDDDVAGLPRHGVVAAAPQRDLAVVGSIGIDGHTAMPHVVVDVGSHPRKADDAVDAGVARPAHDLAPLDLLPHRHQHPRQVVAGRHEGAAVVEVDLEAATVELPTDGHHPPGCRGADGQAGGNDEIGAVVAVVGEAPSPPIAHPGDAHGPPLLDGRGGAVDEVHDRHEAVGPHPTQPRRHRQRRREDVQARLIEAAPRRLTVAKHRSPRLTQGQRQR